MRGIRFTTIALSLLLFDAAAGGAATTLSPSDKGWYNDSGNPGLIGPNGNYLSGELGPNEYRNFFTFDLSGVTDFIASASLQIDMETVATPDASETWTVHATLLPSADFDGGTAGLAGFDDLGSGKVLAEFVFTLADANTVVSIPLSASAVQMLNEATGKITIGGAVTTLGSPGDEHAFAFSGTGVSDLVLETLPSTTTTYSAYSRGSYREDTGAFGTGGAGTATGNYFTGESSGLGFRSFFAFDLSSVSGLVVGARLRVDAADYASAADAESVEIKDYTGDVDALTAGTGGFAAVADLGDGYSYGTERVTAADAGTVLDIPLFCNALADLNASSGNFAIGASVIGAPTDPGGVFGASLGAGFVTELELTTLPGSAQVLLPGNRGWYRDDGVALAISPTANYGAGKVGSNIFRNFFTFDLSGVSDLIVDAYVEIDTAEVGTPDASETWTVYETTLASADFDAGTAGIPGWQDLGNGKLLGQIEIDASASSTVVRVPLTAVGISILNAASGNVTLGGALTTIGAGVNEYVMGSSGAGDGSNLVLTTRPPELALAVGPERRGGYSDVAFQFDTGGAGTPGGNYLSGENPGKIFRHVLGYDLASLAGCAITAQLMLDTGPIVRSPDASETFTVFGTTTDYDTLTTGLGGFAGWTDLGSGDVFGELEFDDLDDAKTVDIPLSASGVKMLNQRSAGEGNIAFGGTVTTLGTPGDELLFGATGVVDLTELLITTVPVPEPDGWLLRLSGVALLALLARARGGRRSS